MLLTLHPENPEERTIRHIAEQLRNGAVMIYPTDTLYAFGCSILCPDAVERILRLRHVDVRKARFSIVCSDLSQISKYTNIDNRLFRLLKQNLPGAFTFILNGNNKLPKLFKNRRTIGLRIPDNAIDIAIVEALGNPIMSASIKYNNETPDEIDDPIWLHEQYGKVVDFTIDGGIGLREVSTVVDCSTDTPEIIRQGIALLNE